MSTVCQLRLASLSIVLLFTVACGDPAQPGPADISLRLDRDSLTMWVGDSVSVIAARSGRDAALVSLDSLRWSVSDTTVLELVATSDSSALLVVRASGTATVTVRLAQAADSVRVTGRREGEVIGRFAFAGQSWVNGLAIADEGTIYLYNADAGELISLTPDLSLRWTRNAGGLPVHTPLIGPDGTIYTSAYQYTAAFGPDGTVRWDDTVFGNGESAPVLSAAGDLYVAGRVFGAPPDSTWRIWRYDTSGTAQELVVWDATFRAPPLLIADSILVTTDLAGRAAAHSTSGTLLWVDTLPSVVRYYAPSAVDGSTVLLPARTHLVAVDALTGAVLRSFAFPTGAEFPSAPIVDADGTIYVQTQWRLLALNADFSVKWQADSLGGFQDANSGGAPALAAGGILYVGCGTAICAVSTDDGSVRWRTDLDPPLRPGPLAIAPDSSIVFATATGGVGDSVYVYRLRGRHPLAEAPWPLDGRTPGRVRTRD